MIFVDTSVWIAFFRGNDTRRCEHLRTLLDGDEVAVAAPVRIEVLSGASRKDLPRLSHLWSALPVFYPEEATWARMEEWLGRAIAAGERFGMGDLLIGAIAAERGAALWSLDSDFARMARLKLLDLYRPS
jgi:predicted nucleic acid-binding protein